MSTTTISRWIDRREQFWINTPLVARHVPFVALVALVLGLLATPVLAADSPVLVAAAALLTVAASGAAALLPWHRWPVVASDILPIMQFAAVICLDVGIDSTTHVVSTIALLPVVALAMKPGRHGIVVGTLGAVVVVLVPALVEAQAGREFVSRILLLPLLALALGVAVNGFTGALRAQSAALEWAAEDLAASRDRILGLIDAAKDQVIIVADAEGRIEVFNQGAEHVLGYTREEAVGHLRVEDLLRSERVFVAQSQVLEVVLLRRDGQHRTLRAWVTPQSGPEGEDDGVLLVGTDITDELETVQLQQSFLGMVSHELRSPITSILGFTELLGLEELDDDQRKYVAVIDRNGRRLLSLVSDLLLSTQVAGGRFELMRGPADLTAVARGCLVSAGPAADAAQIRLMDATNGPLPLEADSDRLAQVVDNLLSNALKFTPAGGSVTLTTALVETPEGHAAQVRVADTGPGVPPDELAHLTERFFRASGATSARVVGAGLGLFIVNAIVEAHGGDLAVESHVGEGTTLTVTLPLTA
ncbi:sensor histidine kinase [Nocardioides insulae]|uniref:sensor histidine kinase n=1 Tax=Nocardioides insulae TaxID=394734 RepID=UPI00041B0628|nr:HAMP domain-containing sensor histidine kinase [Nocardioides insulae]